ncbi:putative toxin-antitoxin system toxin component, PIN family [Pseudomonadota bacterium]
MKVVLDTNVLISGIFFGGLPGRILNAWRSRKFQIAVSVEVPEEYIEVAERLTARYADIEYKGILGLIVENADLIQASALTEPVCDDPDDDKFLACAVAAHAEIIVSGDRALLKASGYQGIQVMTPKDFVSQYVE